MVPNNSKRICFKIKSVPALLIYVHLSTLLCDGDIFDPRTTILPEDIFRWICLYSMVHVYMYVYIYVAQMVYTSTITAEPSNGSSSNLAGYIAWSEDDTSIES